MASIASDEEVLGQFQEDSRKQCRRMWSQFHGYISDFDFESGFVVAEFINAIFGNENTKRSF